MPKTIKIDEIGELIGEEPYHINWFNYDLGGGWGAKLSKYNKNNTARGIIIPGIGNETSINKVYQQLKNNDFSDIAGFYVGILCFFGEKIYENLQFVDKIPKNSINTVVSTLKCPEKYKNEIYAICHSDFDFLDFIKAANRLEKTNFDEKMTISAYKLQGNAIIYPLLCQMFYVNKGLEKISPSLIQGIPVNLSIEISHYLSGCHFPVMVSPMVDKIKWSENQNGWFLYGKFNKNWVVIDVVGVGNINLSHNALANRLNYFGSGGKTIPFLICWNWNDIIESYHYFGNDLLIRDLKNDLFINYWFIFSPKSLLNVRFKDNSINATKEYLVKPNFNSSLISTDKHGFAYLCVDLEGNFINYCDKNDVFYSDGEVFDWFELGKMLK